MYVCMYVCMYVYACMYLSTVCMKNGTVKFGPERLTVHAYGLNGRWKVFCI